MLDLPKTTENGIEVGIDEAGRGCLWGPLYAAAVIIPENQDEWPQEFTEIANLIKDSKKLSSKKRKIILTKIKESGIAYGVGIVNHDEIDGHGVTIANQLSFRRAIDAIPSEKREKINIIIDGCLGLAETRTGETWKTEIDGDAKFLSIATASIIAKESRDAWVDEWCNLHKNAAEKYGFATSKGYGTLKHRNAIKEHGLLEFHRRLYCRNIIPGLIVKRYDKEMYSFKD
jgi:ribonuclease HII